MIQEKRKTGWSGMGMLVVHFLGLPLLGLLLLKSIVDTNVAGAFIIVPVLLLLLISVGGYFTVNPEVGNGTIDFTGPLDKLKG